MAGLMQYTTQAIICLDPALQRTVKSLQAKRRMAGDRVGFSNNGVAYDRSKLYMAGPVISLPGLYRMSTSRLIIIGHGDDDSRYILGTTPNGADIQFTPNKLARLVQYWLDGSRIQTISLAICRGGGVKGDVTRRFGESRSSYLSRFNIDPRRSFAFKFAQECGFAQRITARTGDIGPAVQLDDEGHGRNLQPDHPDFERHIKTVKWFVNDQIKGEAYKVVINPNPNARPGNPLTPVGMDVLNCRP